jgi:TrmH family RNA methyltransferase
MLTSRQNPLVKQIRKLHSSKQRHNQNLFLLEGTNLLTMAAQINYPLVTLVSTPQWQAENFSLWQNLMAQAQRVATVNEEVIKAIATTVNPDGVLATASRDNWQKTPPPSIQLGLILETIQDPGNLGTIIRTAVATEVDVLWLSSDSVDLDHPKVMRASAGEWFRLNMQTNDYLPNIVKAYQKKGTQIIATLPLAKKTYWQLDFSRPSLILLGNEAHGLSSQLASLADEQVNIPLAGGVESLNVAIASALLLYEYQRQINFRG